MQQSSHDHQSVLNSPVEIKNESDSCDESLSSSDEESGSDYSLEDSYDPSIAAANQTSIKKKSSSDQVEIQSPVTPGSPIKHKSSKYVPKKILSVALIAIEEESLVETNL